VELPEISGGSSLVCRIASVDSRGRIAEQSVVRALGWSAGQRLEIRVASGVIVVRADPAGVFVLARRCHVPIPAAVRRWCALESGQRVLLAVVPERRVLVIHTMAAVEEMLHARHAALLGGDPA
jgi:bifunctional DNA-binding transcriptional regulator/antitoxin component of YhaV-PrlF toxin-antitoxin module